MPWDELVDYVKEHFIEYLETQFILRPDTSSLDCLPYPMGNRFKHFKWKRHDYLGGVEGRNEERTQEMIDALSTIRPERRPHTGSTAVLTRRNFNRSIRKYIDSQLQTVPDFAVGSGYTQPKGKKLNQFALHQFLKMRDAALKDNVPLIILASYRTPEQAAANAKRKNHPEAVARFSAHIFGLAIDLKMGYHIGEHARKYRETTTTPMQNVVDMRKSPVHKWMFLRGQDYGWYPFQQEPWHWEYNPPGFQKTFFSNLPKP